jgi:uncharacterized membrane protein YhhN
MNGVPAVTAVLAAASLIASAIYGFGLLRNPPSLLRAGVKAAAVGAVAVVAWLSGQGWLLAVGLTLSALGDVFLAGDPKRLLPSGLVSFLLAHAAYIVVFIHAGGGVAMFRTELIRFAGVLAAAAGAVFVFRLILPKLGAMTTPVLLYMLTIFAMVVSAFALPWAQWPAMVGAAAFLASDGILAVRLFKYEGRPDQTADLAVWWLYYGAQVAIAAAFLLKSAPVRL